VRRPYAEEILGEWGVRDVTPPSQRERERVEADREINPGVGKPLRRRLRNFTPEADSYVASLGGPLPYMQRLLAIEAETEAHRERLAQAYDQYLNDQYLNDQHRHDPARWLRIAERWSFHQLNDLIDRHNRWYPIEARLAMDPRSRDFVKVGGRPYRRRALDAAWILEQFPA
jgi:hypothetical protein